MWIQGKQRNVGKSNSSMVKEIFQAHNYSDVFKEKFMGVFWEESKGKDVLYGNLENKVKF